MAKLLTKLSSFFSSRTLVGVDKTGNRYFTRKEDVDGIMKEKRWVVFKSDPDPTSLPVEWICWLNGQRKRAPTSKDMAELEAKREQIKQNVACKGASPDLESFIKQFPSTYFSKNRGSKDMSDAVDNQTSNGSNFTAASSGATLQLLSLQTFTAASSQLFFRSSEPSGSGVSFKPGTWQPPT